MATMKNASNGPTRRKMEYEHAVRIHISLPPVLDGRKNELCRKFGYGSFSDYVQAKMRTDLSLELSE